MLDLKVFARIVCIRPLFFNFFIDLYLYLTINTDNNVKYSDF